MARFALGAKCGSPRLFSPNPAGGLAPAAKARWRKLASPKRVAKDAQPSTFPKRPRNWRRDSQTDHSFFSPDGIGRSIGVILSSQSLHSGCCFITILLLVYGLIKVQDFAGDHSPGGQFRLGDRAIASLFTNVDEGTGILRICGVVLLHFTKRFLQNRGHLWRRNARKQNQAHAVDPLLWKRA